MRHNGLIVISSCLKGRIADVRLEAVTAWSRNGFNNG